MTNIKKEDWGNISEKYYDLVLDCFTKNSDTKIPNPNVEHAKFLTAFLLSKAKKAVRIFSGNLSKEVYEDPRIKEILSSKEGIKLQIIVEDNAEADLKEKYPNIEVSISKLESNEETNRVPGHFIVIDNESYRYEKNHQNGNLTDIKGTANFNDKKVSSAMVAVFDNLLKPSSKEI